MNFYLENNCKLKINQIEIAQIKPDKYPWQTELLLVIDFESSRELLK